MENEKRLIDANALKESVMKEIRHYWNEGEGGYYLAEDVIPDIDNAPTVDAVSRGVHDQVRWERDTAIGQLEDHGIPFGGIAPDVVKVVRCKDCKNVQKDELFGTLWCNGTIVKGDYFCASGERKDNG